MPQWLVSSLAARTLLGTSCSRQLTRKTGLVAK
jgi:hypothetical protein